MAKCVDLTGQKFGRLTVIKRVENKGDLAAWLCICDCGCETVVSGANLRQGHVKSCGCLKQTLLADKTRKHGLSNTSIDNTWKQMKRRCNSPNHTAHKDYHDRGIVVCERWANDLGAFYEDVSKLPHFGEEGYTLDRIDPNGNYELGNVRWATAEEQANNRRNNIIIEYKGKKQTISQLCKEYHADYRTVWRRVVKCKWDIERALTTPIKK